MQQDQRGRSASRKRKSRWGPAESGTPFSSLSYIPKIVPDKLTLEQQEALLVRVRIEEITRKVTLNQYTEFDYAEAERSPSPEPVYDNHGKRLNTRDQRIKDNYLQERHALIQQAYIMNPGFKPPSDYSPAAQKRTKKIFIPQDKFPDYNFIGLIIGPRGNTQKRMEKETGCKILIRGKGSVKEGKVRKMDQSEEEPLHVLITGDSDINIERAAKMVTELLVPVEDGANEIKKQQMLELAKINGTLRERFSTPPDVFSFDRADVKCAICGETSHPTQDCALAAGSIRTNPTGSTSVNPLLPPGQKQQIENEYEKFLDAIGEKTAGPFSPFSQMPQPQSDDPYDQFMREIENKPQSDLPPWAQQPQAPVPGYYPWAAPSFPQVPVPQNMPTGWHPAPPGMPPMPPYPMPQAPYMSGPPPPWAAHGSAQTS